MNNYSSLTEEELKSLADEYSRTRRDEWMCYYFGNDWRIVARPRTVTMLWQLWKRYEVN
jgi:hypothetical protein